MLRTAGALSLSSAPQKIFIQSAVWLLSKLCSCLSDIRDFLAATFLKLSDDSIGVFRIGHSKRVAKVHAFELFIAM